ncbi:tRNA ligase [Blyttiomyces sp. JEL0837]|nr:tRNA ligase [Blyttiomyces sp. JEL0837]
MLNFTLISINYSGFLGRKADSPKLAAPSAATDTATNSTKTNDDSMEVVTEKENIITDSADAGQKAKSPSKRTVDQIFGKDVDGKKVPDGGSESKDDEMSSASAKKVKLSRDEGEKSEIDVKEGGDSVEDSKMTTCQEAALAQDDGDGSAAKGEKPEGKAKDRKEISWGSLADVPYGALCQVFDEIETTTKRLLISEYLRKFFVHVIALSPNCLLECIYLCLNKTSPEYEGKELGLGESILIKAIANATGRDVAKIKADVATVGDLGSVAQKSKKQQMTFGKSIGLTVDKVFKVLKEISNISGSSAQSKKIDKINGLLAACRGSETKYLIRSLEGKLRIGLAEKTVLIAMAHAFVMSNEGSKRWSKEKLEKECEAAVNIVKQVYCILPNYNIIVPALIKHGVTALPDRCKLTPGIPLKPMLAHPTKSITEVLDRFDNTHFTCEFKYDGERAQIHMLPGGKIEIYSRNSENLTSKYPDIIALMPEVILPGVTSFVLDCEAVAWDVTKGCILPFQVLSTRKRKDVAVGDIQISVCLFAFDILYLNEQPLISESLRKRREKLHAHLKEIEGKFAFAKADEGNSAEAIETFLEKSISGNCEGLMVKALDENSSYEPSVRSRNWLKVKKDYLDGLGDSLDLVVIGGYLGRGKRTGWYGGYLLACYDSDSETYQSICKIGTGFSEEQFKEHADYFSKHTLNTPPSYYSFTDAPNGRPDVWFSPTQVWEVKAADLSISPVYHAAIGLVDPNKGISLRFPRFVRIRTDKTPEEATGPEQIADMYRSQKINSNGGLQDEFESKTLQVNFLLPKKMPKRFLNVEYSGTRTEVDVTEAERVGAVKAALKAVLSESLAQVEAPRLEL